MNKRDLRLEDYGISKKRYGELRFFCEQYPEWKDELLEREMPLRGMQYSDMPSAHSQASQTEKIGIAFAEINHKCRMIEEAATQSGNDLSKYIIKNVCYGKGIAYLEGSMDMPCDRTTFYDRRRYFFYLLNKKRK